jgi:hypothetical protein
MVTMKGRQKDSGSYGFKDTGISFSSTFHIIQMNLFNRILYLTA